MYWIKDCEGNPTNVGAAMWITITGGREVWAVFGQNAGACIFRGTAEECARWRKNLFDTLKEAQLNVYQPD